MIYTQDFLFIHVPKTAGMSITRFLVNALDGPVTLVAPDKVREHSLRSAATERARSKLELLHGTRHETPSEAIELLSENGISLPAHGFAIIRHPLDLMASYYMHMRKPHVWKRRGLKPEDLTGHPKLAYELSFSDFVHAADFYNRNDEAVASYYDTTGFSTFDIVPLKAISAYLNKLVEGNAAAKTTELEHRNVSKEKIENKEEMRSFVEQKYPRVTELANQALEKWAGLIPA